MVNLLWQRQQIEVFYSILHFIGDRAIVNYKDKQRKYSTNKDDILTCLANLKSTSLSLQIQTYLFKLVLNHNNMEISLDEKIKAAIDPLLTRIQALEADNQRFKEEIALLQTHTQPKTNQKPPTKTHLEHPERPQTTKGARKEPQHHEVKPELRANQRAGQKVQQEEGKVQGNKAVVAKSGLNNGKSAVTANPNKDVHDPKSIKAKPTTATGQRPSLGSNNNKGIADKKPPLKNNETEAEKKEEGEEEKKHTSQQKQHKTSSTHVVKSPAVNKPKPTEKPADKKPLVPPSPAPTNKKQPPPPQKPEPKPLKGGKPKPEAQPVKQEVPQQPEAKVEEEKPEVQPSTENQPTSSPTEEQTAVEQPKVETTQAVAEQPKVQLQQEKKAATEQALVAGGQVQVSSEQVPVPAVQHKQQVLVAEQQAF